MAVWVSVVSQSVSTLEAFSRRSYCVVQCKAVVKSVLVQPADTRRAVIMAMLISVSTAISKSGLVLLDPKSLMLGQYMSAL